MRATSREACGSGGEGVENFVRKLSNKAHVEIGGTYLSNGGEKPTAMTIGKYGDNTNIETKPGAYGAELGLQSGLTQLGYFHTHLTDLPASIQGDPYQGSTKDLNFRNGRLLTNPRLYFHIITNAPVGYDETDVIDFTKQPSSP